MLEEKHEEAVVFDNNFHRQLSDFRNENVSQNHPDVEILNQENLKKLKKERVKSMLSSLTGLRSYEHEADTERQKTTAKNEPSVLRPFVETIEHLERMTAYAVKNERPLTLCVIAFPELSAVHNLMGEEVLKKVKDMMARKVLESVHLNACIIGDHTDDRLILVLPEIPRTISKVFIRKIQSRLSEEYTNYKHFRIRAYARIGLSCIPDHGETWQELLARADLVVDSLVEKTRKTSSCS